MSNYLYNSFVRKCLNELAEIEEEIYILDPEMNQDRINYLRKEALRIQSRADIFSKRGELVK